MDAWICRQIGVRRFLLCVPLDPIGDAEALGVQPVHLPKLLRRPPHGAEQCRIGAPQRLREQAVPQCMREQLGVEQPGAEGLPAPEAVQRVGPVVLAAA